MILVDSDVLIAHLRGVEAAHAWLRAARRRTGRLHASVVSLVEVEGGMRSGERREVRALFQSMTLHDVDEPTARRAGQLMRQFRRSHPGIGLGDHLIAATALEGGLHLATLNLRHFPMFEGLQRPFELG